MTTSRKTSQLGQVRPTDTNVLELYSPSNRDRCVVHNIIVCNTTSSVATYRIFVDEDGTTTDQTTAIAYDIPLDGNSTELWQVNLYMNKPGGQIAVRTDTGSALTFTANGEDGSVAY